MNKLSDKIVVVTGGNGNIAYESAKKLAGNGARIISIVRKNLDAANKKMSMLPNSHLQHFAILASITDTHSIKEAVSIVKEKAGKCNILINAAGITSAAPTIQSLTDEIFDNIVLTNLRGTFAVIREFHDLLRIENHSLIINISSTSSVRTTRGNLAYAASKAGMNAMTQNLAKNLGPSIRVVGISPGYLTHATSGGVPRTAQQDTLAVNASALNRLGTAEDIAEIVESLSVSMKFITGQTIIVDGGMTL